jgi:UDP-N-acetyl-D-mannosaminuronate dehydrogenase
MKAVAAGHDVVGIDASTERVKRLAAADSFVEDVPGVALDAALRSGRYSVTDDALACEGFDVAVVTVPTPLHEGAPDLSYIESAARMLAPHVRPGQPGRAGVDDVPGDDRAAVRCRSWRPAPG